MVFFIFIHGKLFMNFFSSLKQVDLIPEPGIMLITPGGKPALAASSANFKAVMDVTYQNKSHLTH